jgi:hypothetical protein
MREILAKTNIGAMAVELTLDDLREIRSASSNIKVDGPGPRKLQSE